MLLKMQPRLPQYSLTPSLQALQRTSYGYTDYGSYTAAHYSPSTTCSGSTSSGAYHQYSGDMSGAHCSMTSPVSESFSYYEDDGGIHTPSNSNAEEPSSPHDSISSPPLVVSSSNPQSPAICSGGSFSPSRVPLTDTGSTPPPSTMSYGATVGTSHHHQQETLDANTVAATSSPLYKYPGTLTAATTPNYLPMTPYSPSAASYPSLYTADHSSPSSSSSNPSLQYCSGNTGGAYNGYYFNTAGAASYTPTTAVQYGSTPSVYPSEYIHHNTTGNQYPASQNSLSTSSNSFALWNNYPTVQVGKVSYDTPRFKLTPERAIPLIKWFEEHKDHPYPSRHEKMVLCQSTQLTFTQVSTWFANARRRMKKAAHDGEDEEGSISDEEKMT